MSHTDNPRGAEYYGENKKQYSIRLKHDGCWMIDVTSKFSGSHVIEKAFYHGEESIKTDIILYLDDGASTDLDGVVDGIRDHPDVNYLNVLDRVDRRARLMVDYDDDHSVNNAIADSEIMPIEPVRATNGVEHWSVLMNPSDIGSTLKRIEDDYNAEIQSIRGFDSGKDTVFTDLVDRIYDDLSPRQTQSLLVADKHGYYNWPRHATANEIAEELGVSGPTCLEHLRKGEQKIVRTVIDVLQNRHGRT